MGSSHTPFFVSHRGRGAGRRCWPPIGIWDAGGGLLVSTLGERVASGPGPEVESMFGERDCVYNVHLCLSLRWVIAEYLCICA